MRRDLARRPALQADSQRDRWRHHSLRVALGNLRRPRARGLSRVLGLRHRETEGVTMLTWTKFTDAVPTEQKDVLLSCESASGRFSVLCDYQANEQDCWWIDDDEVVYSTPDEWRRYAE